MKASSRKININSRLGRWSLRVQTESKEMTLIIIVAGRLSGTFILGYCTFKTAACGVNSTHVAWSTVHYCSFNKYSL